MSVAHASIPDLVGWRMRALGLWPASAGPAAAEPAASGEPAEPAEPVEPAGEPASGQDRIRAVADRMLALQGQDWNAARWALGLRAPGTTEADVVAAFDSGRLVRSWPMRGTIHLVPAEDLRWMQLATGDRVLAGAPKRRQQLGLDETTLARMAHIAVDRLTGGRSLSRDELAAAWAEAGIGDSEQSIGPWRYHVIWWLCQTGITVPGPVHARGQEGREGGSGTIPEPRLVLAEEWIRSPRQLEGEEALAELAARFALGRGPVQEKDLAWWSGLTVRRARAGIAAAADAGRIAPVEVAGSVYWADPALLEAPVPARDEAHAMLLPSFDEHLLGYTDRTAVLDEAHFERIVPGRNGMFRATVVRDGRVVGVWLRTPRAKLTRIEIKPFPGETVDVETVREAAESWGAFRGTAIEIVAAQQ